MSFYRERATALRAQAVPHINCAQAVAASFAAEAGVKEEDVMRLAAGFGGGMKRGAACGALTGAIMVLGLFGLGDPETIGTLHGRFREKTAGNLDCADLLKRAGSLGVEKKPYCDGLVLLAVDLAEEILREKGRLPSDRTEAKE
ncbi:MAG: C_GCAxxG_C_C family protein [Clostridia bacterium]|nr:C_GCAxxG_C_C family protein [Clostridia bacterium]